MNSIILENNKTENLKDLQHITFTRLQELSISRNFIVSLDRMDHISMPHLAKLHLSIQSSIKDMNHINSIKVLRKCSHPSLSTLTLCTFSLISDENHILDTSSLCALPSTNLKDLVIDFIFSCGKKDKFFTIRFLPKL